MPAMGPRATVRKATIRQVTGRTVMATRAPGGERTTASTLATAYLVTATDTATSSRPWRITATGTRAIPIPPTTGRGAATAAVPRCRAVTGAPWPRGVRHQVAVPVTAACPA